MNHNSNRNHVQTYYYSGERNFYANTPYKTLQEALELVQNAVQGERNDELFYDYLISVAPTQEEKDIITDIRNDEREHNRMFREIYTSFTGQELPQASNQMDFEKPASYLEGIKHALFGELAAMERYRIIRAGLPSRYYRDMVFEILTDELKHADKYNYILNLNSQNQEQMNAMQSDMENLSDKSNDGNENGQENEQDRIPEDLLRYIEPIVDQAMKEAQAGTDLRYLFRKYILIGILIGNGFPADQGVEQVKAWEYML